MQKEINQKVLDTWKKTRAGAWAARGFHYQHLFVTLILVRQWAGMAPVGNVVPEGLEDCVIELPNNDVWLQIKSRKAGEFSKTEVETIFSQMHSKAAHINTKKKKNYVLGLEQRCSSTTAYYIDKLFLDESNTVVISNTPEEEIIALLTSQLDTSEIIAEGLASDLYKLVAQTAAENAAMSFEGRRRISTTEIERRIFERLEAEDPSAIDRAFIERILEPVDLVRKVQEPGFYQGIKVNPGHVNAGLVIKRPKETASIIKSLKHRRSVLITGPSGAGKSALLWLTAKSLASEFRWLQVTPKAGAQDADAIVRFVRSRRPNERSSIALAFDEVGASNSDLWDIVVRELRGIPNVYCLGSVRKEDVNLITNCSDAEIFDVILDEQLAQSIWGQLSHRKQTTWAHWREPFEQSQGLMLEYVHLLTQGKRLATIIEEQVRQREKDERTDELAIIRSTAELCARGGEVEAAVLFGCLGLPLGRASQALKRLLDEHLVRESRPGVLGGLHRLRSEALSDACHDEIVYRRNDSLWLGIRAATSQTIPRIIQTVLADARDTEQEPTLHRLAEILLESSDAELWIAILTGLGLGTLERHVERFTTILEQQEIDRAQWSLASMFADDSIDVPSIPNFVNWERLRAAIYAYRETPKHDLRKACLEMGPIDKGLPACVDWQQANRLLTCLVPIAGEEKLKVKFAPNFADYGELDIEKVAPFLSTSYLIERDMAKNYVTALGGESKLFNYFQSQTPWLTAPVIERDGDHGRTVRSNWIFVSEDYQPDPHETVCRICETLIAISPDSEAAASDAIDPSGHPITVGDHRPWSKNMPRRNIPAKARVAWNVAFRQILLARAGADSLTEYTRQMSVLVKEAEKAFRNFSEKWIKGKTIVNADTLAEDINGIIRAGQFAGICRTGNTGIIQHLHRKRDTTS